MGILIRSFVFNLIFYLNTAVLLIACLPFLLMPRKFAMYCLKFWSRTTQWWFRLIVGVRLEVRGGENLPSGPILVAIKHQSAWDTAVLHMLFDDPAMVLKKELIYIPLMGTFTKKFGLIAVDRAAGASALKSMLSIARQEIAKGRQILIFPEGNRKTPGAEPDYKPGVALLYRDLNVPCVPVALNSGLFWPRRRFIRKPGVLVVEFLSPIPPGLNKKEFMRELQNSIETKTDQLIQNAKA